MLASSETGNLRDGESPWEGMGGPKSLGLRGRCQESSASASAIGPAAAASATALTHGADVLRQRARAEDAVPATADNEAKPTAAATTAATTAARTEATTTAARTEVTTEATTK